MKQIIDGKRYNTDTAEEIGCADAGLSAGDFNNFFEQLYRTSRGNWFLAGSGGGLSKYRQRAGDMWTQGERIFVVDPDAALAWCERHAPEAAEKYFSDTIEDA